jgi:hypothetical protein
LSTRRSAPESLNCDSHPKLFHPLLDFDQLFLGIRAAVRFSDYESA